METVGGDGSEMGLVLVLVGEEEGEKNQWLVSVPAFVKTLVRK